MNTRFNYVPIPPRDSSKDDIYYTWTLEKRIKVLSSKDDGSVDSYVEEDIWVKVKNSWKEFIKSFSLGSTSQQVIDHLTKGTPLLTAHTLPDGDYTQLSKGAEIVREMTEKGITLDMIMEAYNSSKESPASVEKEGE